MEEKKHDLCERLFEFAVRVSWFSISFKTLPSTPENMTDKNSLPSKRPVQLSKLRRITGSLSSVDFL